MLALHHTATQYGVGLHIHLLETPYQKEYARRRTGTTAVQHLGELGLLGPQLTLGHGVWLSEDDIARVVETGVMICHNASSNLRLRSGVAPVNHFLAHGVRVSLGLDEAGINDDRDMVQEMRLVLRLHRTPGMDERVPTCPEVFRMATEHGAQTTGFAGAIGTLEPGKAADLVVMNRQSFAYPYLDDSVPVLDAIVHRGKASGVETVLVAGEPVLPQGQFTRINKAEVLEELATALHGERAWLRWVSTSLVCDIRGNRYVFDEPSVSMVARFVGTYRRRLLKDGVMDYRRLGNSGLQVSVIGLGTNNFGVRNDYPEAERILMQAIEEGINFIETSNTYGEGAAEEFIGKALKGHRDQVLLATKVASNMGDGPNQHGASRKHILTQVEASLKRLQTDYLDLYQIHYYDPFTPLDESLRTLHNLVMQGKVRYIGCSNFAAWQVAEAMGVVRALDLEPLVSVEPEYSMLKRGIEKELLPCCQRFNIGILPYFPLASGFLTGKYKRGQAAPAGTRLAVQTQRAEFILTDENFDVLEQLEAFASARSRTMVELAFAWLLTHSQVSSVIAGATRPEQIIANAKASEWRLTSEEMNELNDVLQTLAPAWDTPTAHLRPYRPW